MSEPQIHPTLKHIGLFEGIGGFSIAASWMGWTTKAWCEIDPFCQKVLNKNFPTAHGFGDIKKLTYATYKSVLRNRGERDRRIDIITGGFPCQPVSTAGLRKGKDDDRWLWPEMLRTGIEFKARWIVGENVAGLLSMDGGRVFAGIVADLENAGYTVETFIIPACGVGAPHKRDRVWIVAHRELECAGMGKQGYGGQGRECAGIPQREMVRQGDGAVNAERGGAGVSTSPNAEMPKCEFPCNSRARRNGLTDDNRSATLATGGRRYRRENIKRQGQAERRGIKYDHQRVDTDPNGTGLQKRNAPSQPGWEGFDTGGDDSGGVACNAKFNTSENNGYGAESRELRQAGEHSHGNSGSPWKEHWLQVATRMCRVDDGIPGGLDGAGGLQPEPTKKKAAGKGHRIKALGNSIVPQIAYEIFKAIDEYERAKINFANPK